MERKRIKLWADKRCYRIKQSVGRAIFVQIVILAAAIFTPTVLMGKTSSATHTQEKSSLNSASVQPGNNEGFAAKSLAEKQEQASATESPENTIESSENTTEHWLASGVSHAAGMLKNGNVVDSLKSQLHSMAVSEANQAVQNWLQRYGTVRLQANVDDRGRLEGSQFDMLLPLYDTQKQMAFTQFGLRHINSRTTANFGLGQRHFFDTSLFGYNAFLDHDITGDHTRIGIGAEYARDFMKFGANGYFRASGWKEGKKLQDYDERPASGFDLRAEGYMPTYPQLGGTLVYEQYFGHEVGLLSGERRQKNPAAFTLGVNYTPIPLVTLGLNRRQSASGSGETLFNLGLNYEIGTPWSKQVEPDAVASKRTLQGGRYDLVERNNQIVLEYRKKDLVHMTLENRISGRGNEIIPLNVTLRSKYGLKKIIWDTAALEAGGGKLEKEAEGSKLEKIDPSIRGGTHYRLTLPPYRDKGNNTYILSGVAYDNQGNASDRAETQIRVLSSEISIDHSGFEIPHTAMLADGKTQTTLWLKVIDMYGKKVTKAAGNIKLFSDLKGLKGKGKNPELNSELKEIPEDSGIYKVLAESGEKYGEWKIQAVVDGHDLAPAVIDFSPSLSAIIDVDKSQLRVSKEGVLNPDESVTLQLALFDKNGNVITGVEDYLKLELNDSGLYNQSKKPSVGQVKELPPGSGQYEWAMKGEETKGQVGVTAFADGLKIKTTNVTFGNTLADMVSDTYSKLSIDATQLEVDENHKQQTTLRLDLRDTQNKPITGVQQHINFSGTGLSGPGSEPTIENIQEDPNHPGNYTANLRPGTQIGKWTIMPVIDGKTLDKVTGYITFTPSPSLADSVNEKTSTLTINPKTLEAGSETPAHILLILQNKQNQPMTGKANHITFDGSELSGNGTDPKISDIKEDENNKGTYTATIKPGTKTGDWRVTLKVDNTRLDKISDHITFTPSPSLADSVNEKTSTLTINPKTLEAGSETPAHILLILQNKQNQPMTGKANHITFDGSELSGNGTDPKISDIKEDENNKGTYTATIKPGTKTGDWRVTLKVDNTRLDKISDHITFTPSPSLADSVNEKTSTLTINPKTLEAGSETPAHILLILQNKQNQPMTGKANHITFDGSELSGDGTDPKISDIKEDENNKGTYTATIKPGTKTGDWRVTLKVDNTRLDKISDHITFTPSPSLADSVNEKTSTLTINPKTLEAGSETPAHILLILQNKQNQPMTGKANHITFDGSELSGDGTDPKISDIKEDENNKGTYTATIKPGTKTGDWRVTLKVDNTRLDKISDHITFTPSPSLADSVNEKTSTLTINPKTLEAGSETPAHILLILQNKQNQPMTGKANHITFDGSELSGDGTDPKISDIKEDENNKGTYTATIKPGTKTGDWRVTLKVDNTRLDKISDHITFTPSPSLADSVNEKTSTLTINPKTLEAGSETPAHILLILQNKQNQPMTGKANHITFDGSELSGNGTDPKISDIKEDENNKGTYTATIKPGTKTGDWRVTLKVDNTRLDKISDHITFTPSPSLADSVNEKTSTLTINPKTLEAGSETPAHILLILQNKQNQPMTGKANHITFDGSELSGDGTDPKISDIKEDENNKGTYTATIKPGTKTGDWRVTLKVDNTRLDKISDHITFTPSPSLADSVNEKTSTLTINPKTLEAGSETPAHILLILQNKQNQPMTGKANHITFDGSELSGDGTDPKISDIKEDENNKGTYTATIKPGTKTGDWRVTLKVDNTRLDKISDHITFTPSPSLADSVNEKTSTLTINPKTLEAGSETPAHILLILQNKQNQPMTGKANHITFDGSELSGDGTDPKISDIKEDENNKGTYTATIKPGTKTGDWRVTLKVDNTRLDKISDNINFEPPLAGRINESKSEFRIASETLEADNQMKTEISLILKDNDSQPITGVQKHIHFEQSELPGNGDKPKISDIQENGSTPGTYTATLTAGTQIGSLTVTPKAGEKALSALAKKVEFTPVPLKISKLKLQVVDQKYLVVGQTLKVDYSIDNNSENGVDNSFYAWGEKGKTAAAVKTLASSGDNGQGNDGTLVTGEVKNGEGVPPYEIQEEHAGKVLEFSILARNGINTRANDIVTLSTDDSKDKGNDTESKIEGGRVANVAELIKITLNPKEGKGDEIKVNGKLVLKLKARTNETKDATSDSAELAVTSIKNGQPVAWVPVKIEMEGFTRDNGNEAVSQDKVTTKLGDAKGPLIDGLYTDGSGQLVKTVSDPEGKGLRTTLNVVADGVNGTTVKDETDIIFTVITSPDVQGASRWGHMEDIVKIKGQFYRRPLLSNEFKRVPASVAEFNSEAWALSTFEEAREKCSSVINSTLVSQSDLKKISGGVLYSRYGWPAKTSALASWDAEGGGVKLRTKQPDYSKGPYTHICLIKNKE